MNGTAWREKVEEELSGYLMNFLYIMLFFSVFTLYRRLLMAEFGMSYGEYGISIIKSLILAKVIMLGDMLHLGRRMSGSPLIFRVFYTTIVFALWVVFFRLLEVSLVSVFHGKGVVGIEHELLTRSPYEMLAHGLIVVVTFFPFFTLRELGKAIGKQRIKELFFSRPG